MGVSFAYPLAAYCNLEDGLEFAISESNFLVKDQGKTAMRSVNFLSQHSETKISETLHPTSEKVCSLGEEIVSQSPVPDMSAVEVPQLSVLNSFSPKHEAAVTLQKVYKSFRTRRKLADCAVTIEQSWWRLLDFAELKHSSISFFDIDKHETAISRWSRARTRAAKVGKGLSKNGKAQKLALQHWLEAIDPRHRYGHNLHLYYVKWLHSQSKEPFFYWLDIGEGKEVNLIEKCPRSRLQQQCIKYLGPMERRAYEVVIEDGILCYKQTQVLVDTTGEPKAKWIFVLSTTRVLYVGKKKKGTFQHSSFLAGGAALAAGRIVVEEGVLKAAWPHSGHYRPTPESFQGFLSFLKEKNVELNDVKLDSADEEDECLRRSDSVYLTSNSSEVDLGEKDGLINEENDVEDMGPVNCESTKDLSGSSLELSKPSPIQSFGSKLTLEIPSNLDLIEKLKAEDQAGQIDNDGFPPDSPVDAYETAELLLAAEEFGDCLRPDMSSDNLCPVEEATFSGESFFEDISPTKGSKNYQLSGKWSTGAGPRIGILRDYPSQIQSHALEQANLSPRSSCSPRFNLFSHTLSNAGLSTPRKGDSQHRTNYLGITHLSPLCKQSTGTSSIEQS